MYTCVRKMIIDKKLFPNQQLKESEFSKKFNTSRTPIRKAFAKLEKEGYVKHIKNKGTFIMNPSKKEILDAYKLRIVYVKMLSKLIIKNVKKDDILELKTMIDKEPKIYNKDEILKYINNNKKFHMRLAKISDNKYLIDSIDRLLNIIDTHLIFYDTFDYKNIRSIKEHKLMIKYLKKENYIKLKAIMIRHVKKTYKKLVT
ncbi:MAG: GntR family transcriptional regulator [Bacillota bacterium]